MKRWPEGQLAPRMARNSSSTLAPFGFTLGLYQFFDLLSDSPAWPILRIGLHTLFFASAFYVLRLMYLANRACRRNHLAAPRPWSIVPIVLTTALFAGVLAYQATWQLGGFMRPSFLAFMQLHDRRQFNPAHRIKRGRILDRGGRILAFSQYRDGRVVRFYPFGPTFAHIVGYSHPRFGATGLEASANAHLNGSTPADLKAWATLGRQLLTQDKEPEGQDLILTLDADLQQRAYELVGDRRAAVVFLRPQDGAIRVLLSTPAFDPNRIALSLFSHPGPGAPLLNRATQGLYPPGSTFKVVVGAMALERGFDERLACPADGYTTSSIYPKIRDHDYYEARRAGRSWRGHGRLDLSSALAVSSNVFFAQLGVRLGPEVFYETAESYLFDRRIPLHETPFSSLVMTTGRLPRLDKTNQYGLAQMSIGQGRLLVTPAQMALIASAIANRGVAMRPRLVRMDEPRVLERVMSVASADRMARMMRRVVTDGTAEGIDIDAFAIAGKTGTAQNPHGRSHSWFIGFAPAERPTLAFAVLVEQGGYGSTTAAPIARDLLVEAAALGLL